MSDTDDTEILLLIPPNFFLVNTSGSDNSLLDSSRTVVHKPKSSTSDVLGKLVTQVHSLENRLDCLEISVASDTVSSVHKTLDYSLDSYTDRKYSTFPRRRKRKVHRTAKRSEISITSLDSRSSVGKYIPCLPLNENYCPVQYNKSQVPYFNDSQSMDGDISSIVSTPSKKNDKLLLHEIDDFLNKVESYGGVDCKGPDSSYNPENVIRAAGEYISQDLDGRSGEEVKLPSGRTMSYNVLDKYIYLVKNCPSSLVDEKAYIHPDTAVQGPSKLTENSQLYRDVPKRSEQKSPIVRKLSYSEGNKDVQITSTPKKTERQSRESNLDNFRPSTNKMYERASKVLEKYKNSSSRNSDNTVDTNLLMSPKKDNFKVPQSRGYSVEARGASEFYRGTQKLMDSIDTELLSLSDLWSGRKEEKCDNGKLEEERLKREHCEVMIQELQKKLLNQQEKLAVALKVDRAKDSAINRLREAWMRMTNSLEKTEARHKDMLDKMASEVEHFKNKAQDSQKKADHFEAELYKALDLAHDYQEKCKQLNSDKVQCEDNSKICLSEKDKIIECKNSEIENLKDNYDTLLLLNKQSSECIRNLETNLEKERQEHRNTQSKLLEISKKTETIHDETTLLLQERDLLKEKVHDERNRNNNLEKQLAEKECLLGAMQKHEDTMENEMLSLRQHIELQKNELKSHYQKQLEEAVLSKLQEFQQQLEHAERDLDNEARAKQCALTDAYNKQILRIQEQHKLEIKLLEEKELEQVNLYRLQLAQASEKITLLESKLQAHRARRSELAAQLHAVMQAQWRQALRLLTNAPNVSSPPTPQMAEPLAAPHTQLSTNSSNMYMEGISDNELHQYVQMLLKKPPTLEACTDQTEEPTSDKPKEKRRSFSSKPPWKS